MTRKLFAFAAAILLAGAVTPLAVTTATAQPACKPKVSAKAVGRFEFSTRITVRNRWKAAARDRYGRNYTVVRARNKDERCDKSGPGARWICRLTARPCA